MNPENNSENSQNKPKWWTLEGIKSVLKDVGLSTFIIIVAVLIFRAYVAEPYLVDGSSMDPTFKSGDYLIVDKISSVKRGDVVVFKAVNAKQPNKSFIKRIIGLPGETVVIKNGLVTIVNSENPNGFVLNQSYITHTSQENYQKTLEGDEYFVMGDNRTESYDSRYWGPLSSRYITGKPIVRLFSVKMFGPLPLPGFNHFDFSPGKINNI